MTEEFEDKAAAFNFQKRIRFGERLNLYLRAYVFVGICMAVMGAGFVIYSRLKIELSAEETLGLAISFAGVLIAMGSYAMVVYRRAVIEKEVQQYSEAHLIGRFVEAWARFEEVSRQAAFGDEAESTRYNLREILSRLGNSGQLSVSERFNAEHLLQIRNALVHGVRRIDATELDESLNQVVKLISKLS